MKQATDAIAEAQALKAELEASGAMDKMQRATDLMRHAANYMGSNNKDAVVVDGTNFTLVRAAKRFWATTIDDIPDDDVTYANTEALVDLVDPKVFQKLTKRVADPDKIDRAIRQGTVKLEDIEPAYIEIPNAPYLRRGSVS